MSTTISVNKQNVTELLSTGKAKPFLIPEYQRPYAWSKEEVITLFEDLWNFSLSNENLDEEKTYFLGSIVSNENENKEQEIIDGQQRLTSLFLLLRAIYTKLSLDSDSKESKNFMDKIEQSIWKTDKLTGEVKYSEVLLNSKVISNQGNEILKQILRTGEADINADDNYSVNYREFQYQLDKFSADKPIRIYAFIYSLLNQAILLPISADSQDTALTIFSTLNNRGLPLSDSDIFKAKIYNQLPSEEKEKFIAEWKELYDMAQSIKVDIQKLFSGYTAYLKACENDVETTTPALRKYYQEKEERLFHPELLENLKAILNIWKVADYKESIENEPWSDNVKIHQMLDILLNYENDVWRHPVIVYYLCYKDEENFEMYFLKFLRKLIVFLLSKYFEEPAVMMIKWEIIRLNIAILSNPNPNFHLEKYSSEKRKESIKVARKKSIKMLLRVLAYEYQDELLPSRCEVEHILPKKWQDYYSFVEDEKVVDELREHLGNKLLLEKKYNIAVSNKYFMKKCVKYKESNIKMTQRFVDDYFKEEWLLEDIKKRDEHISTAIESIFLKWSL